MNGELLLKGYKFQHAITLNLQANTILTGHDTFLAFEIFNMLQNYFNRQHFSDYYLDQGTAAILNGAKLSGNEFVAFRLKPNIDINEELKITKKSIFGQFIQNIIDQDDSLVVEFETLLNNRLVNYLNGFVSEYGLAFTSEKQDAISLSKYLNIGVVLPNKQEILLEEHSQLQAKSMMVKFIEQLNIGNKKKLLLVELPEYGLSEGERKEFFSQLQQADIDNIVVFTNDNIVCDVFPKVFHYHLLESGSVGGFDDYDELEKEICESVFIDNLEMSERIVVMQLFATTQSGHLEQTCRELLKKFFSRYQKL